MSRQIFDPDSGLNYNAMILTGDPYFEMGKIYIAAVQIVARLRIAKLDDTVL